MCFIKKNILFCTLCYLNFCLILGYFSQYFVPLGGGNAPVCCLPIAIQPKKKKRGRRRRTRRCRRRSLFAVRDRVLLDLLLFCVKMAVCNYFLEGRCRFGDKCWNEHPEGGRNQSSRGGGGPSARLGHSMLV